MLRLITLFLCVLLSAGAARAEALPSLLLTLPEDMIRATEDDASAAAALLGTDEEQLRAELSENGVDCLVVSPEGTLWQVDLEESGIAGLDLDALGQKKTAILAQELARSSGQDASVVKLTSAGDAASATPAPDEHHSSLWICLSPGGTDYPRRDTWITAIRGWQVTVTCTWPSQAESTARAGQLSRTLLDLALALPRE